MMMEIWLTDQWCLRDVDNMITVAWRLSGQRLTNQREKAPNPESEAREKGRVTH